MLHTSVGFNLCNYIMHTCRVVLCMLQVELMLHLLITHLQDTEVHNAAAGKPSASLQCTAVM